MGALFHAGGAKASGWFDSSRPKTSRFDNLVKRGKGMTAQARKDFLEREDAKEAKVNGLGANTPLSSRYA